MDQHFHFQLLRIIFWLHIWLFIGKKCGANKVLVNSFCRAWRTKLMVHYTHSIKFDLIQKFSQIFSKYTESLFTATVLSEKWQCNNTFSINHESYKHPFIFTLKIRFCGCKYLHGFWRELIRLMFQSESEQKGLL